ncbi:MAG: hypothetical protein GXP49_09235 [Deltaproteobacteria bacterium]|nr:hypothetical protein [Deltaproteobacteria bacterium]
MIVAEQKPIQAILATLQGADSVLLAGCRGCVTVCGAGGEKEVRVLASLLKSARNEQGRPIRVDTAVVERQCEPEFVDELPYSRDDHDAVLSMACGAGVQLVAERLQDAIVLPALDTTFIGVSEGKGTWVERCKACGDCKLHLTAGICPVTRCSKGLLNGPCGGSSNGACEVDPSIPCAWQLIVDRLERLGMLDRYEEIIMPADWSEYGKPSSMDRGDIK